MTETTDRRLAVPSGSETVASLARRMAELPDQSPAFVERARRLAERSEAQRYHIAVLGEFKRGKSTLVNALIGQPELPTGVVPVTTVATEIHFADPRPGALVVYEDGTTSEVPPSALGRYVSERENPANQLGVRRVELRVGTRLGADGVVIVDTPGVASVNERQTIAAKAALSESDGAVVVLSVDAPLSESEEQLVTELADRGGRVFVAVNKCDHLSSSELSEVRSFLTHHLERLLDTRAKLYFVSARRALLALSEEGAATASDPGFDTFRRDLETFLRVELADERERTSATELDRLASALFESVAIERAAANLDLAALGERLSRFRAAAESVRREFANDRLVLEHDVAEICESVGQALASGALEAADRAWPKIEQGVGGLRGRALDHGLEDAVAAAVTDAFEPLRHAIVRTAEVGWEAAAARFAAQLRHRVLALRTAANALFDVHLPEPVLPAVAEQRERFSYVFLQVETPGSSLARTLRTAVPTEGSRRGMLERARRRLSSELDKHAGRARFDVVQRLDTVSRRFVSAMGAELDATEASIVNAATRAQQALESTESRQAVREVERARVTMLADAARQRANAVLASPRSAPTSEQTSATPS